MTQKIQPMRQKMQHSMVFVLTATLVIAYIFLTGIMYRQTVTTVEEEIHREADYISKAVQISGTEYLNQMDEVRANTRMHGSVQREPYCMIRQKMSTHLRIIRIVRR